MSNDANKKIVSDFLGRFEKNDIQGLLDLMTDDATWWIAGKPELFSLAGERDKKQMQELLEMLVPATKEGLRVTPKAMLAEGDKVAVEAESYAEFKNGRIYNNDYHFLIQLRDGKIKRVKEYMDTMHTADVVPT